VTAPLQTPSDSVLIEKVMAGDEAAFSIIYDRYSSMMFGMLMRVLRDHQAAQEVLQDVFLQLWRGADRFDAARGSLAVWLLVIGRNRAISRLRSRAGQELLEVEPGDYANSIASPQNVENEASRRELIGRVMVALAQLPAEQKEAVELACFEGLTQTEIAAKTGSPLGTVKTRVRAAMESLKRILDDGTTRQPGRH
jgi:RNA polymerase sigma-70 factor (ECF subfamily)